jgi:hypothetical protein
MDESHVLARLDRIEALDRSGAPPRDLLPELRGLLREAEALARTAPAAVSPEEVVERRRTAPQRT